MNEIDAIISRLPKVVLHDHLDGGLRPDTVAELAEQIGHKLPKADDLGEWFVRAADSGDLVKYLETFDHTVAVMQTPEALYRVAYESARDLSNDGVIYAEQRYAPEQHVAGGLSLEAVVEAVQAGFNDAMRDVAEEGKYLRIGTLLTAMRHLDNGVPIAELCLKYRDQGVVGFDIAGPEDGFLPSRHTAAFQLLRQNSFPVTIHAGEAAGLDSLAEALHVGLALRLGHGVRIIEDISADLVPGRLASWVLDNQIPLEVCPSSNVQTGISDTIADHPVSLLHELGFAVTVNTDNRLMSGTSMSREMSLLVREAEWSSTDLYQATLTAAWNAFIPFADRQDLVDRFIVPAFDEIGEQPW